MEFSPMERAKFDELMCVLSTDRPSDVVRAALDHFFWVYAQTRGGIKMYLGKDRIVLPNLEPFQAQKAPVSRSSEKFPEE